jgi:hypothetical protein
VRRKRALRSRDDRHRVQPSEAPNTNDSLPTLDRRGAACSAHRGAAEDQSPRGSRRCCRLTRSSVVAHGSRARPAREIPRTRGRLAPAVSGAGGHGRPSRARRTGGRRSRRFVATSSRLRTASSRRDGTAASGLRSATRRPLARNVARPTARRERAGRRAPMRVLGRRVAQRFCRAELHSRSREMAAQSPRATSSSIARTAVGLPASYSSHASRHRHYMSVLVDEVVLDESRSSAPSAPIPGLARCAAPPAGARDVADLKPPSNRSSPAWGLSTPPARRPACDRPI